MEQNKIDLIQTDSPKTQSSAGVNAESFLSSQKEGSSSRFYCDALYDYSINNVIGSLVPHLITLVGFSEIGKSTFVSSMYHELMINGCIGEYQFIDSDTFAGFERRAYVRNAKISPERRLARTTNQEGYFLTMEFIKGHEQKKLIISDRSGETYQKVYTSDLNAVKKDVALINSPHIIFFIDVSSLMNDTEFLSFKDSFGLLLTRMQQADVFVNRKTLDILFNQSDKLVTDKQKKIFEENAVTIKQMIKEHGNISQEFNIISNRMVDNEGLNNVFKYMVSSCDAFNEDVVENVDWVSSFLKD
jgi:hypothetical protein